LPPAGPSPCGDRNFASRSQARRRGYAVSCSLSLRSFRFFPLLSTPPRGTRLLQVLTSPTVAGGRALPPRRSAQLRSARAWAYRPTVSVLRKKRSMGILPMFEHPTSAGCRCHLFGQHWASRPHGLESWRDAHARLKRRLRMFGRHRSGQVELPVDCPCLLQVTDGS